MPALDRAYRASPVPNVGYDDALRLALRLWRHRDARSSGSARGRANGEVGNVWMMATDIAMPGSSTRSATRVERDDADRELRLRAESACVLPAGRFPLGQAVEDWTRRCELYRGIAYGYLSFATLSAGAPQAALAEADSTLVAMRRAGFCGPSRGYLDHALASLALGDTATARRDFIAGSAGYPAGATMMLDSARAHLGARFDDAAFRRGADSARRARIACESTARERAKAKQRELGR